MLGVFVFCGELENCCASSGSNSCGYVVSVEDAAYVVVEGVGDKGEVECEWGSELFST